MELKTTVFILLATSFLVKSEHLILGDANNKLMVHHVKAEYYAIPFFKKIKNVFYNSPDQRVINAIMAYDNLHSKGTATVTAGGIGYTYVNLRLKSERGKGLEYDIGIYS